MTAPSHSTFARPRISSPERSLHGRAVVITRPAGTGASLARQVHACGGVPVLLPGLSLRRMDDAVAAQRELAEALTDELIIFNSPAAVRFAADLRPLHTSALVLGVGAGTQRALLQKGMVGALAPQRQDSEGLLDHPLLRHPVGRSIALIGAAGGRGLLREQLQARGARLREVHVYQRLAPRLNRRHVDRIMSLPASSLVFFSSGEAVEHLCRLLPGTALDVLRALAVVASSQRLAKIVRDAGFSTIQRAASASSTDLLQAALSLA